MQCLLEQKAEVNMATADDNFAPAHEAARAGQLDCLKLLRSLFKRNSTISYSDLHALANALFDCHKLRVAISEFRMCTTSK